MATKLLTQNCVLCFFRVAEPVREDSLMRSEELPILVHHNHYPCIYYEELYKCFRGVLPETATKDHLRITAFGRELPSNYPIGLYIRPD